MTQHKSGVLKSGSAGEVFDVEETQQRFRGWANCNPCSRVKKQGWVGQIDKLLRRWRKFEDVKCLQTFTGTDTVVVLHYANTLVKRCEWQQNGHSAKLWEGPGPGWQSCQTAPQAAKDNPPSWPSSTSQLESLLVDWEGPIRMAELRNEQQNNIKQTETGMSGYAHVSSIIMTILANNLFLHAIKQHF